MKLAIVGYRKFNDWNKFKEHVDEYVLKHGMPEFIISGGASGADSLAERWAKIHKIPMLIMFPEWKKYGKFAGIRRNADIVRECTHMIAFPSEKGRGTQDSIKKAEKEGKIIKVIEV
jgi:hypothetical protein